MLNVGLITYLCVTCLALYLYYHGQNRTNEVVRGMLSPSFKKQLLAEIERITRSQYAWETRFCPYIRTLILSFFSTCS